MRATLIAISLAASAFYAEAALIRTHTERLLRSTYKIEGAGSVGTAFVVLEPVLRETNTFAFVLVTAAHVLEATQGADAKLWVRSYDGTNYTKGDFLVTVRTNGAPVWVRHQSADVAVMRIPFGSAADISMLPSSLLADDGFFRDFEISPGDQVHVIGFPLGVEGNVGFGILRSGQIASFPLTPSKTLQTFLLNFPVFRGNSGGPVFMAETRHMKDGDPMTVNVFRVMGLVSQELSQVESVSSMTETTVRQHKLGLAVVVHAELIRDTIKMLPLD